MSNDLIERFLRNNLDDDDYKEYSAALDELCTPKRKWVSLTDAELDKLHGSPLSQEHSSLLLFVRDVEAQLRSKNT